jgi:hypothetical protein
MAAARCSIYTRQDNRSQGIARRSKQRYVQRNLDAVELLAAACRKPVVI